MDTILELERAGYRFTIEGDQIRYTLAAGHPDPATVKPLLEAADGRTSRRRLPTCGNHRPPMTRATLNHRRRHRPPGARANHRRPHRPRANRWPWPAWTLPKS